MTQEVPATLNPDAPDAKTRRRQAARTIARPVAKKTKVTLCLDDDAATRLGIYAVMTSQERSAIVSQLIRDSLKRFRVQDLDRDNREDRPMTAA